jgi:hypothetical protein
VDASIESHDYLKVNLTPIVESLKKATNAFAADPIELEKAVSRNALAIRDGLVEWMHRHSEKTTSVLPPYRLARQFITTFFTDDNVFLGLSDFTQHDILELTQLMLTICALYAADDAGEHQKLAAIFDQKGLKGPILSVKDVVSKHKAEHGFNLVLLNDVNQINRLLTLFQDDSIKGILKHIADKIIQPSLALTKQLGQTQLGQLALLSGLLMQLIVIGQKEYKAAKKSEKTAFSLPLIQELSQLSASNSQENTARFQRITHIISHPKYFNNLKAEKDAAMVSTVTAFLLHMVLDSEDADIKRMGLEKLHDMAQLSAKSWPEEAKAKAIHLLYLVKTHSDESLKEQAKSIIDVLKIGSKKERLSRLCEYIEERQAWHELRYQTPASRLGFLKSQINQDNTVWESVSKTLPEAFKNRFSAEQAVRQKVNERLKHVESSIKQELPANALMLVADIQDGAVSLTDLSDKGTLLTDAFPEQKEVIAHLLSGDAQARDAFVSAVSDQYKAGLAIVRQQTAELNAIFKQFSTLKSNEEACLSALSVEYENQADVRAQLDQTMGQLINYRKECKATFQKYAAAAKTKYADMGQKGVAEAEAAMQDEMAVLESQMKQIANETVSAAERIHAENSERIGEAEDAVLRAQDDVMMSYINAKVYILSAGARRRTGSKYKQYQSSLAKCRTTLEKQDSEVEYERFFNDSFFKVLDEIAIAIKEESDELAGKIAVLRQSDYDLADLVSRLEDKYLGLKKKG